MSIARQYGLPPAPFRHIDPMRAKHIRIMAAEAEQILRIGFNFNGERYAGDLSRLAEVRLGLLAHLRPTPLVGSGS